jgi:hypothetical protein
MYPIPSYAVSPSILLTLEEDVVAAESKYGRQCVITPPPGPCLIRMDMV